MRKQPNEVLGFIDQFSESDFGSAFGKFEDVRRVFWHRSMRISEACVLGILLTLLRAGLKAV